MLRVCLFVFASFLMLIATEAVDASEDAGRTYHAAIQLAAEGKLQQSITALQAAASVLPQLDTWRSRMESAAQLLTMQKQHGLQLSLQESSHQPNLALAQGYLAEHPAPEVTPEWPVAVLATVIPGAGHAWLGRWHDAKIAALMVWPLLILTIWALKRKMGPVTVFFGLLTVWFWSGTVFSTVSLVRRGFTEAYLLWWQGLWQASGLPGVPWS